MPKEVSDVYFVPLRLFARSNEYPMPSLNLLTTSALLLLLALLAPSSATLVSKMHVKNFSVMNIKRTPCDLILSSGLLAFARHAGVIAAMEDSNLFCIGQSHSI